MATKREIRREMGPASWVDRISTSRRRSGDPRVHPELWEGVNARIAVRDEIQRWERTSGRDLRVWTLQDTRHPEERSKVREVISNQGESGWQLPGWDNSRLVQGSGWTLRAAWTNFLAEFARLRLTGQIT